MKLNKKHISLFQVDFDLCDAGGVIYHPNYLVLLDRARAKAMESANFPYPSLWKMGQALAVIEVSIKYSRAFCFGDQIAVITHLKDFKGSRLFLEQAIFKAEELASPEFPEFNDAHFIEGDSFTTAIKPSFKAELTLATVKLNPLKSVIPCQELMDMINGP